ncbi:serine/threonine protein kinase [Saprolegnia diclina VS20]|uniref:Serine/threonine protein kinase n=1 Tax=Saprolegnia diclina (strain VS20) TaxID=1156394 RepID=T0PW53_SAPDV|nr:serine/threonine protein kinase [Saprolegnia diclina VS20]EQC25265.1 serine/threonine protein kinase [Saprolegnia diclina VS20]|eukprot:XP_008621317.1 serine/threonine protein kinase [Saprolegnia diclina VS20]
MADVVCSACGEATNILLAQCASCSADLPSEHERLELLVGHVQALSATIERLHEQVAAVDLRASAVEHEQHQLQRDRLAFEVEKQQWYYERQPEEPPIRRIELGQFASASVLADGATYDIRAGTIEGKTVVQKRLRDPSQFSSFVQLASFLSLLKSDYIVSLLGSTAWKAEIGPALYFEHMELTDLRSYMASTPRDAFSWDAKFQIALGVAHALSYLHKMDLCHGALRLDHVLLNGKKHAKLTGFQAAPSEDGMAGDITAFGQLLLELASHGREDLDAYDSPKWYKAILEHCVVDLEEEQDEVQPSAVDLVSVFEMYPSMKRAHKAGPTTPCTVTVHRAQGLANPLVFGAPQRYCRVRVGGQVLETKVQDHAHWNEACIFDAVDPLVMELEVDILNADGGRLGKCSVALLDVMSLRRPSLELWLQVYSTGKPCGELHVTLEFPNVSLRDRFEAYRAYLNDASPRAVHSLLKAKCDRILLERGPEATAKIIPGVVMLR